MSGRIKKTYRMLATLAFVHALILIAGVAFLFATDRLDAERVRAIASILQGEHTGDQPDQADIVDETRKGMSEATVERSEDQPVREEIAWRNAERYRTQLEQRLNFISAERLDVNRRREEWEALQEKERNARDQAAKNAVRPGYEKELAVIGSLSPKAALAQILTMDDADAARALFDLDTRKSKKIVEAAKTEAQRAKVTKALRLMRDIKRPSTVEGASAGGARP